MEEYVIETKDLSKYFGKHRAVNQVNMHVRKGCIYGLIGRNGAGKTTIMKMLTGLSSQSEGDIVLFGHTHEKLNINMDGIHLFNPGTVSMRSFGKRSYGVMTINSKGEYKIVHTTI